MIGFVGCSVPNALGLRRRVCFGGGVASSELMLEVRRGMTGCILEFTLFTLVRRATFECNVAGGWRGGEMGVRPLTFCLDEATDSTGLCKLDSLRGDLGRCGACAARCKLGDGNRGVEIEGDFALTEGGVLRANGDVTVGRSFA